MNLDYFKDKLFDLINEHSEELEDIISHENENIFIIQVNDGSQFEIECREHDKKS